MSNTLGHSWFKRNKLWVLPMVIGLISEVIPVPGLLAAALVFPTGIHSGYGTTYVVLALLINFVLFAGGSYLWLRQWNR